MRKLHNQVLNCTVKGAKTMQAELLKRRFEIKDDLHRLISSVELACSLKTEEKEVKKLIEL